MGKEFKLKCPLDNNEVEDVVAAAVVAEAAVVVGIADPSVVDVVTVVAVDAEAAPEAVAGNVVGLDDLPLTDQCRGVAVGQLPHPEDEGLAQPLVRIKTEAEVNLKTILWFFFFWHAKCILSCLSCSRSFYHYFVLSTYITVFRFNSIKSTFY